MSRRILLTEAAVEDLQDIRAWFGQPGSGASAAKTVRAILDGVARLRAYPHIGRVGAAGGGREYFVRQHRIIYSVDEETITVLAIFGPGQRGYDRPY